MSATLSAFTSGVIAMGFFVSCLFFIRFWQRTRDDLFLAFASAFALLALAQTLSVLLGLPLEERSWLFLLRLAAFSLLALAILMKNLKA